MDSKKNQIVSIEAKTTSEVLAAETSKGYLYHQHSDTYKGFKHRLVIKIGKKIISKGDWTGWEFIAILDNYRATQDTWRGTLPRVFKIKTELTN